MGTRDTQPTDSHLDLIRRRQNLAKLDQAVESAAAVNPISLAYAGEHNSTKSCQARKHPIPPWSH